MPKRAKVHSRIAATDDDPIFPSRTIEYTVRPGDSAADRRTTMEAWWTAIAGDGTSVLDQHLAETAKGFSEYLRGRSFDTEWLKLLAAKPTDKRDQLAREVLIRVKLLSDALKTGNARDAAANAIWLTQARMEFNIRPHSQDVRRSQTTRAGGDKGRKAATANRSTRAAVCLRRYRELKLKNQRITKSAAAAMIAREQGLGARTVQRYLAPVK